MVHVQRDPVGACPGQLDKGRKRGTQGGHGRVVVDLEGTPDLHEPGERAPHRGERRVMPDGKAPSHAADDRVVVRRQHRRVGAVMDVESPRIHHPGHGWAGRRRRGGWHAGGRRGRGHSQDLGRGGGGGGATVISFLVTHPPPGYRVLHRGRAQIVENNVVNDKWQRGKYK